MFDDWMKLLIEYTKNNYLAQDFICPECGKKSVDCIFVGNPAVHIGYLPIWCKNCNQGIQISRVKIPEGAPMIEFGDFEAIRDKIPNFKQIVPNR